MSDPPRTGGDAGARAGAPPDRVEAHPERDLDHRPRGQPDRGRADPRGHFVLLGIAFILGSSATCLDGRYSRMSGKHALRRSSTRTLDRVEEGVVLAAVAAGSRRRATSSRWAPRCSPWWAPTWSATRARAEALGVECKVGIASRAVRVVILSAGGVRRGGADSGLDLLEPAIYVMAALTIFTAFQRVLHVRRQLARAAGTV